MKIQTLKNRRYARPLVALAVAGTALTGFATTASAHPGHHLPGPAGVPGTAGPARAGAHGHARAFDLGTVACPSSPGDAATAASLSGHFSGARMGTSIDAGQIACARAVIAATKGAGLDQRAALVATMTAMAESTLHNYTGGDRDSIGLFQQRPSQGWGSVDQVQDPTYATQKFLSVMQAKFPGGGWESGDPGAIAQSVQVSGDPGAYDDEQSPATTVVNALWAGGGTTPPPPPSGGSKVFKDVWATAPSVNNPTNGAVVGTLNTGSNYFYCQTQGSESSYAGYHNDWWLKTDDDSGNANVWVNATYVSGGVDDGQIPGVPTC
ncbi:hypothetical protein [Allobranchiibius sp. GilTou38]|uniref:hypothetical protein n=1 Tax=Allobranchiibius sp. GilTou38 TaxID=2815210 RepID=UPI001AA133A4|nr:hypothetical protein [Allobranchiibius sp. GilTou38]MBO1768560.1 hypothetical protein [Allobranchiibius sp. GilTou38]